ncbi:thiamine phosphate synthase [Sodalis-like secondary symbiont of Drepanosiphum platanoidis]|uniref:thiamine phosphate synthase n=1 Tax=Sodalis-like secondary symbiont of Drepanosiphum platanoidis TaxID=2994493 RepID=UPI00346427C8
MNNKEKFLPVPFRIGFYPIVNSISWLVCMLDCGVKIIQLRIKNKSKIYIEKSIEASVLLGNHYNAKIFINDYWQLAIRYRAYGVHLGQEDMIQANKILIRQSKLRLGLSTHNEEELNRSLSWNPSYIALGHIFPTSTKNMLSKPQGLKKLKYWVNKLKNIPTVAIGGINLNSLNSVLDSGVGGISVISAIIKSKNWRKETKNFMEKISKWEKKNKIY